MVRGLVPYPEPMLRRLTLGIASLLTVVTPGVVPPAGSSASAPSGELTWGPCEEGIEEPFDCATLTVPLDYTKPAGDTLDLALIRYPANPAVREGAILLNPGGPGGSGIDVAIYLSFGQALGGLPADITDRFDIVGFDPRGVGDSDPVKCIDAKDQDASFAADPDPVDQAAFDEIAALNKKIADGCAKKYGSSLRSYSTEQAARDRLRRERAVAGRLVGVPDGQLAQHPADHAEEIVARREVGQERLVFPAHRRPVGAVEAGVVEVVAVDAPDLVEDLGPLGARVDLDLHGVDGELALVQLDLVAERPDEEPLLRAHEHLLAARGEREVLHVGEQRLLLALLEVEAHERALRGVAREHAALGLQVEELALLADLER